MVFGLVYAVQNIHDRHHYAKLTMQITLSKAEIVCLIIQQFRRERPTGNICVKLPNFTLRNKHYYLRDRKRNG